MTRICLLITAAALGLRWLAAARITASAGGLAVSVPVLLAVAAIATALAAVAVAAAVVFVRSQADRVAVVVWQPRSRALLRGGAADGR
jgi:hypothetical protein